MSINIKKTDIYVAANLFGRQCFVNRFVRYPVHCDDMNRSRKPSLFRFVTKENSHFAGIVPAITQAMQRLSYSGGEIRQLNRSRS
ncbi:MAG: hypothetical protein LBE56_02405 [Tannerella sp.]|nr:hypothetical protein [Tannerella sp.]